MQENERGVSVRATHVRYNSKQEQADGRAGTGESGGEHGRNLQCDPPTILKIPLYYMFFFLDRPSKINFLSPNKCYF